jgi:hypothetical protein
MAGLDPAIHVFLWCYTVKTWMPGTRPGMTSLFRTPYFTGCILSQTLRSALFARVSKDENIRMVRDAAQEARLSP